MRKHPCHCEDYNCLECRKLTQQAVERAIEACRADFSDPALLTIVPTDGMVEYDEIGSFALARFKRRHQTKLSRHLPKDCRLVGAVDVTLKAMENTNQGWSFHSHSIVSRPLTKAERKRLKRVFPSSKEMGIYRPVHVQQIDDSEFGQTAAYVYKSYFLKRSQYMTKPKGKRKPYLDNNDIPLSAKEAAMLETYLKQHRVADPIILLGLKRVRTTSMTDMRFVRTRE